MYAIVTYERLSNSAGTTRMARVNWDKNAVRNMEYIYNYHLELGERPDVFVRGPDAESKKKI